MSVQKILPLARKMGEENFQAYKNYVKTARAGQNAELKLKLKNVTIIDTINFSTRDGAKVDIAGFRNLLREIHKKYFPRAGSSEAEKTVNIEYKHLGEGDSSTKLLVSTFDDKGFVGRSLYKFRKKAKKMSVEISSQCEDFKLNLQAALNLNNADLKQKQNIKINAVPYRDLKVDELGDILWFRLNANPTKELPKFNFEAEIDKAKFGDMFNGGLEKALPELIEKSGIKLF